MHIAKERHLHNRVRFMSLVLALMLIVAGCGGPAAAPEPSSVAVEPPSTGTATSAVQPTSAATPTRPTMPTQIPMATQMATQIAATTASTSGSTAIPDTQILEAKWYADSDGNSVPDFIEAELGYDPATNDCAANTCGTGAEGADFLKQPRNTLLMLDSSGSMAGRVVNGETKLEAAKAALKRYASVISTVTNVGFLVYGHKGNNTEAGKAESCVGIELLAPLGQIKQDTLQPLLDTFQPVGWTPIAAALEKAGEAFAGKQGAINRILLVSDGIETCGGDPVATARRLKEQGLDIGIDVIGFDIEKQEDVEQLRQIAKVTGGEYIDAKTRADLEAYVNQQFTRYRQTAEAAQCELKNFSQIGNCDSVLTNKAITRIGELQRKDTSGAARSAAYSEIIVKIQAAYNERSKAYTEAAQRSNELSKQFGDLLQQLNRSQYSP